MGESRRLRNADKLPKPSQLAVDAIRTTAATMGRARALQAAEEVVRRGYITQSEREELAEEFEA